MNIFVTCSEGTEPLLIEELRQMGYAHAQEGFRGVYVEEASEDAIYKINYCSRLAIRVLLPLVKFRCFDQKSLYKNAYAFDWRPYFQPNSTFAIDANVHHRSLRNSLFAAQVVKDAICDQFRSRTGGRPSISIQNPDVQLNLFIHDEKGVISLDTSGTPLHKRGYRQEKGEAPLQETLAAALLALAKYQGTEIVFDPCCGSGTILIEAALIASQTPPGYLRQRWGFMQLPEFSMEKWLKVKAEADSQRKPLLPGHFFGCDNNKEMVRISKVNLRAAGFHRDIDIVHADFREYDPPTLPNFVISNPPHGLRLETDSDVLAKLYRSLGELLKSKSTKPGRGFVFTGNLQLAKEIGLNPKQRHVIHNNGVESRFLEFDIY
jgi:putative N6-adenine-specific DNA methylase